MESSKEEVERLYERPDLGAYNKRPSSKRGNHMALASYPHPGPHLIRRRFPSQKSRADNGARLEEVRSTFNTARRRGEREGFIFALQQDYEH